MAVSDQFGNYSPSICKLFQVIIDIHHLLSQSSLTSASVGFLQRGDLNLGTQLTSLGLLQFSIQIYVWALKQLEIPCESAGSQTQFPLSSSYSTNSVMICVCYFCQYDNSFLCILAYCYLQVQWNFIESTGKEKHSHIRNQDLLSNGI